METLSVVYIIDQLECGGAERVLITLANIFYAKDHKTTVITTVSPGSIHDQLSKDVQFICLYRKWKWNPFTMYKLIKELRKYDIIHVHSSHNLKYVWLAGKIFFLHKPIFFHEHFGDIEIDRRVRLYQRIIYPQTFMICVSSKIVTWATENLNLKKARVFLL